MVKLLAQKVLRQRLITTPLSMTVWDLKKKLVPSFGEKYSSSEDLIQFRLVLKNGSYFIQFFNALQTWEEKITSISAEELILFHSEKTYHYKRHQKITLE